MICEHCGRVLNDNEVCSCQMQEIAKYSLEKEKEEENLKKEKEEEERRAHLRSARQQADRLSGMAQAGDRAADRLADTLSVMIGFWKDPGAGIHRIYTADLRLPFELVVIESCLLMLTLTSVQGLASSWLPATRSVTSLLLILCAAAAVVLSYLGGAVVVYRLAERGDGCELLTAVHMLTARSIPFAVLEVVAIAAVAFQSALLMLGVLLLMLGVCLFVASCIVNELGLTESDQFMSAGTIAAGQVLGLMLPLVLLSLSV